MKNIYFLGIVIIVIGMMTGCSQNGDVSRISLSNKTDEAQPRQTTVHHNDDSKLRIAVGGMITPKAGFAYYKRLLDYIGEKSGKKVEFVDREDYAEINNLVEKGEVDVAFVCGGPYVDGHEEFGMELLAAPVAYGDTVYYSYIIVSKDSAADSLEDLRGKSFAFTDPLSNTGKLVPTYMLAKLNETPESYFSRYDFTHGHDKSIKAVATGIVEGAAVDSLIWEYANRTNPEFTSKTKIIIKSPPYGIPPVVVRQGLPPELKEGLKRILQEAHNDPRGKEILKGMMVDKFVPIKDSAYDSIRKMKKWVEMQKAGQS